MKYKMRETQKVASSYEDTGSLEVKEHELLCHRTDQIRTAMIINKLCFVNSLKSQYFSQHDMTKDFLCKKI